MAVNSYTDYFFPGYLVLGIFVGLVITVISVLIYISIPEEKKVYGINAASQSEGEFRIVRIDYISSISSENLNKLKEACKYFFNVVRFYEGTGTTANELYIITQGEFKYATRDPFTGEILSMGTRDPPQRYVPSLSDGDGQPIQNILRFNANSPVGLATTVDFRVPYG